MRNGETPPVVTMMLAVRSVAAAVAWYERALGATQLWNRGSVAGMEISGARFFLAEPADNGWESPERLGTTTLRVEVFCDDPDGFIARAVEAGADGSRDPIRDHETPWGRHRQGGFVDPFGHIWLVGDRTPLQASPPAVQRFELLALDHVQLAMPPGQEDLARRFYRDALGLPELEKPPELRKRGGVWFGSDAVQLHLGVEPDFRPAGKAHPAIRVRALDDLASRLSQLGHEVQFDEKLPGFRRFYVSDPFGNRLEFLEPVSAAGVE